MDLVAVVSVVSVVISVVALVAAGLSVKYTRDQAKAAAATIRIDAARRHEESTPLLTAEIEPVSDGSWYRLVLTHGGPLDLGELDVEIIDGPGVSFPSGQYGVAPMGADPVRARYAGEGPMPPLRRGDSHAWRMEFDEAQLDGKPLRLRRIASAPTTSGHLPRGTSWSRRRCRSACRSAGPDVAAARGRLRRAGRPSQPAEARVPQLVELLQPRGRRVIETLPDDVEGRLLGGKLAEA